MEVQVIVVVKEVRPVGIQANVVKLHSFHLALLKYMLGLLKNKLVLTKLPCNSKKPFQQLSTYMSRNTNYHDVSL